MIETEEKTLESLLGYYFSDPELKDQASSRKPVKRGRRPVKRDERPGLAALGEAVIGCVVASHFYSQGRSGAEITEERLIRVCRENHTRVAREIGLERFVQVGAGKKTDAVDMDLGESLEEILGAVYLDDINAGGNGVGACWEVLKNINLI